MLWIEFNLVPEDKGTDVRFEDVTQHGTSVAGIIASKGKERIRGINSNVDLYSIKVLDDNNSAPISRVIEGIKWAMQKKVDIINMSFGTSQESEALGEIIKEAYDQVIAVGAVNAKEEHSKDSAIGEEMELVAPGEQIKSLGYFGGDIVVGGTSMSASHVTGVASLLWQKDLGKSNEFIRELMKKGAKKLGSEKKYGKGLVDVKYTNEIYDQFSKEYEKNVTEAASNIKENQARRENFDNIAYVQGSWTKSDHEKMVGISDACHAQYGTLTNYDEWEVVKWAAKIIDEFYPGQAETMTNMAFHGAGNYIANYIYHSRVANNGGSIVGANKPSVTKQEEKNYLQSIDNVLKDMTSEKINNKYGEFWAARGGFQRAKHRSQVIFGFALHVASDAYAHRTKIKESGKWKRLVHTASNSSEKSGADDTTVCKDRWNAAKQVIKNAIAQYNISCPGSYKEFVLENLYTGNKMGKIRIFCLCRGSTIKHRKIAIKGCFMGITF